MSSLCIILLAPVFPILVPCDHDTVDRYLVRKDTITSSTGDAVATNSALQIPDPWPRGSHNTNIAFDGERIARAVGRYREGEKQPVATTPETLLYGSTFGNANASSQGSAAGPAQGAAPPAPAPGPQGY